MYKSCGRSHKASPRWAARELHPSLRATCVLVLVHSHGPHCILRHGIGNALMLVDHVVMVYAPHMDHAVGFVVRMLVGQVCIEASISIIFISTQCSASMYFWELVNDLVPISWDKCLVVHGWINMGVESGHLIPSPSYVVIYLTWDLLGIASCGNKNFILYCLSSSWVSCLVSNSPAFKAPLGVELLLVLGTSSRTELPFVLGTPYRAELPIKRECLHTSLSKWSYCHAQSLGFYH